MGPIIQWHAEDNGTVYYHAASKTWSFKPLCLNRCWKVSADAALAFLHRCRGLTTASIIR